MIYLKDNKSILCKGDFRPAQFYKGKKRIAGYAKESFESERHILIESFYKDRLHNVKIHGNEHGVGDIVNEGEHTNKYKISVAVRGKNLLKAPLDINSWEKKLVTSANYSYNLGEILPLNETVTLSFDYTTIPQYFYFLTDDESVTTVPYSDTSLKIKYLVVDKVQNVKLTFTPKEGKSYYLHNAMTANNTSKDVAQAWLDRFTYIQIEYGSEATEYEEYKEGQDIDFYLDAPLGSDEYVDFENKKVVRNTAEEKLDVPEITVLRGVNNYEVKTRVSAKISGEYKKTEE